MSERLESRMVGKNRPSRFLMTEARKKDLRQVSAEYDAVRGVTVIALRIGEYPTISWTYCAVNDAGHLVAVVSGFKTFKEADAALEKALA